MPRSLRLILAAVLLGVIFTNAACEDDPDDLKHVDAGDNGDDDDAG